MSKISELLALKRAADITRMETGQAVDTSAIDAELATIEPPAATRDKYPHSARLRFTSHAYRRMSQRGLTAADVYAIYMGGECRQSGDDLAFVVTDRAITESMQSVFRRLQRLRGAAIIVGAPDDAGVRPLVTVLRDGEDTRFYDKNR